MLTGFETSIEISSQNFRVKDLFTYQNNKVSVTCTYQTLFDHFQSQIASEEVAIQDAEIFVKRNNESVYGSTIEQTGKITIRKRRSTMLNVGTIEKLGQ